MKEPAPLPDDLLDYIAAEREPEVPAASTRKRMYARLAPFIVPIGGIGGGGLGGGAPPDAFGGAPPVGAAPGVGSAAGAAGVGAGALATGAWHGKLFVAALSAAIGAGGGAATHAMLATPRAVPLFVADPVAPKLVAPMEHARAVATAEPIAEPAATLEPAAAPVVSARAEERARGTASLRDERLLIETANAALLRGDNASAIAALRRHAAAFPRGELAQEREVLLVQALRASGDDAAADKKAKDFKQKFPGSLQQGAIDKASPK